MADTNLWIRRYHPSEESVARLVCLPHAGGSASFFFTISRNLSPQCEVLAVQYPGRQDRRSEPCVDNVPALANMVTDQLLPWTNRPLFLFGHSLGALIAFEVARQLEERGHQPVALLVSGRRAPSRHRDEAAHLLSDTALIEEVKALNGTDSRALTDDEIIRMSLPAIRSDYRAAETYQFAPGSASLRTAIYAHVGLEDPKVSLGEAQDWAKHTTGLFQLHSYPGGHFYLINQGQALVSAIKDVVTTKIKANHTDSSI